MIPIFTIGHSTQSIETFISLLEAQGIETVADVRTIPASRHNPQFNGEALSRSLSARGIGYLHLKGLGGLRRPRKDSPNTGWRTASFRGFADYLQTEEFVRHLEELIRHAAHRRTALMCAEAVPWRCHRSLIADALVVRGIEVLHIIPPHSVKPHLLTPWAKVQGQALSYPGSS